MTPLPSGYHLEHIEGRLTLVLEQAGKKHYLCAEFLRGPLGYRKVHGLDLKQPLPRALGLKTRRDGLRVLDGTAGLGQDAFIMACLGCEVTLLERSEVMFALLMDGLTRAAENEPLKHMIEDKIKVFPIDFRSFIQNLSPDTYPDVVYLDPMFPARKKSALTKIEMRIIRDIVGNDDDMTDVLKEAFRVAKRRVVVKRPLYSPHLQNIEPDFIVSSKKNRYDVYLTRGHIKIHE